MPSIQSVSIASNATLSWVVDPTESCEITSFIVDIIGDREDEYHFAVTENFIDLYFLVTCEKWQFTVTPISNEVTGFAHTITAYVPLPPGHYYFQSVFLKQKLQELNWVNGYSPHVDRTVSF